MIPFPSEQIGNFHRLAPEIILCAFGIVIMVADPFSAAHKRALGWLAFIGTLGALTGVHLMSRDPGNAYSDLIRVDAFSIFVHVVVIGAAALAILGSFDYLDEENIQRGEYYALVLLPPREWEFWPGRTSWLPRLSGWR